MRKRLEMSSRAGKCHAGQVVASGEGHFEDQVDAGLAFDERLRLRAWRASGPGGAGFKAWGAASGAAAEVDFIGSGAVEGHMRAIFVVPSAKQSQLALQGEAQHGDHGQNARTAVFHGADESFDHCDASRLANGSLAVADAVFLAPGFETIAGKLGAAVSDEMLGRRANRCDYPAYELADLLRGWLFVE